MIYVLRAGEWWKVGHTLDAVQRAYQTAGQTRAPVTVASLSRGNRADESIIHRTLTGLRAMKHKREWYRDCAQFHAWHIAIDAAWRGQEVLTPVFGSGARKQDRRPVTEAFARMSRTLALHEVSSPLNQIGPPLNRWPSVSD